jgi:hypothetical protein
MPGDFVFSLKGIPFSRSAMRFLRAYGDGVALISESILYSE